MLLSVKAELEAELAASKAKAALEVRLARAEAEAAEARAAAKAEAVAYEARLKAAKAEARLALLEARRRRRRPRRHRPAAEPELPADLLPGHTATEAAGVQLLAARQAAAAKAERAAEEGLQRAEAVATAKRSTTLTVGLSVQPPAGGMVTRAVLARRPSLGSSHRQGVRSRRRRARRTRTR